MSARISLCLIARNEEAFLDACLRAAAPAVDEMIVCDTGSTDRTVEIAAAHGARVVHFRWVDDFAAARNAALAAATGDWILSLDADEVLAHDAPAIIRAAVATDAFDCGMLPLHNATHLDAPLDDVRTGTARHQEPVALPRLLRRTADLAWSGAIHESLDRWFFGSGQQRRYAAVPADIIHFGNVGALRLALDKASRNRRLLDRYIARNPEDSFRHAYLVRELVRANDVERSHDEGLVAWRREVSRPRIATTDPGVSHVGTMVAWTHLLHGDAAGAYEVGRGMRRWDPSHPNGAIITALALAIAPNPEPDALAEAEADLQHILQAPPRVFPVEVLPGAYDRSGPLALAGLHLRAGRAAAALAILERIAAAEAPSEAISLLRAECLLAVGRTVPALRIVTPLLGGTAPDAWAIVALGAARLGKAEESRRALDTALGRGRSPWLQRRRTALLDEAALHTEALALAERALPPAGQASVRAAPLSPAAWAAALPAVAAGALAEVDAFLHRLAPLDLPLALARAALPGAAGRHAGAELWSHTAFRERRRSAGLLGPPGPPGPRPVRVIVLPGGDPVALLDMLSAEVPQAEVLVSDRTHLRERRFAGRAAPVSDTRALLQRLAEPGGAQVIVAHPAALPAAGLLAQLGAADAQALAVAAPPAPLAAIGAPHTEAAAFAGVFLLAAPAAALAVALDPSLPLDTALALAARRLAIVPVAGALARVGPVSFAQLLRESDAAGRVVGALDGPGPRLSAQEAERTRTVAEVLLSGVRRALVVPAALAVARLGLEASAALARQSVARAALPARPALAGPLTVIAVLGPEADPAEAHTAWAADAPEALTLIVAQPGAADADHAEYHVRGGPNAGAALHRALLVSATDLLLIVPGPNALDAALLRAWRRALVDWPDCAALVPGASAAEQPIAEAMDGPLLLRRDGWDAVHLPVVCRVVPATVPARPLPPLPRPLPPAAPLATLRFVNRTDPT